MTKNQPGRWVYKLFSTWFAACKKTSLRQKVLRAARKGDYALLFRNAEVGLNETLWHYGADHPETGRKLAALAAVHAIQGEYARAEPLYRRAIYIMSRSINEGDRTEALTFSEQLAELFHRNQDSVAAHELYAELLSHFHTLHAARPHKDIARTLDNLALTLQARGLNCAAKEKHSNALLIWEKVCGPGSPEVSRCLTHLASLYLSERRYEEAEPLLLRAVAAWESSPNPDDLYAIITLSCCGDLYRSTGRGDEARNAEDAAKAVLARYAE